METHMGLTFVVCSRFPLASHASHCPALTVLRLQGVRPTGPNITRQARGARAHQRGATGNFPMPADFNCSQVALGTVWVTYRSLALPVSLLTHGHCAPLPSTWSQTSTQVPWILLLSILLPFPISLSYFCVLALAGLSVWGALAIPTFLLGGCQASVSSPISP